jgi:hypothetical protein
MTAFCYFVPGPVTQLVRNGRLVRSVLPAILEDCRQVPDQVVPVPVDRGPGDVPGVILYPKSPVPDSELPLRLGYFPQSGPPGPGGENSQTWRPIAGAGPVTHIGWETDAPPKPEDLARRQQIDGYMVRDDHNHSWVVPIARAANNPVGNLPRAVTWDADDQPVVGVSTRYADFWRDSARLADLVQLHGTDETEGWAMVWAGMTAEEDQFAVRLVLDALAINYRVDRHVLAAYEQAWPGWLSQACVSIAANAIVDCPTRRAWQAAKKKDDTPPAAAGMSSTPGAAD